MMVTNVFTILVVVVVTSNAQDTKTKYRGIETAPYFVNSTHNPNDPQSTYEMRTYPPAMWITTQASYGNPFNVLFRYISGNNVRGSKIAMTSPVLNTYPLSNDYTYEMAFYLPKDFQANPPAPLDRRAALKMFPTMTVYARTYGGWSNTRSMMDEFQNLVTALNNDNKRFLDDVVYTAGYDSPMYFGRRRNEIWLIANEK